MDDIPIEAPEPTGRKLLRLTTMLVLLGMLAGCQCSHQWTEASCTAPKTCSICDRTEGETLQHQWTEASCTAPKTCSICGRTEGETLQHQWTEASCTAPKTCSTCGRTEGETLQHQWRDATCSQKKTCSLCGTVEGNILPHDYQRINGQLQCRMCDSIDVDAEVLPPLHFPQEDMTDDELRSFINLEGQNNLRNNARFQYNDGFYYGQYWDDNGQSLLIRTDLVSGTAMLLDYGWAKNIFISGENIYYENIDPETQDHGIYRITMKNGEYDSREKICSAYGSMQLKDGCIYYSDFSDQFIAAEEEQPQAGLYRCDSDGSNVIKILDKPVYEFYVFDTGILYVDWADGESIHICYPDGSGDVKLNSQRSAAPIFDGEYIYYLSTKNNRGGEDQNFTCWKIRTDGTENQQVSIQQINHAFLIHQDTIYFCNASTKSQLFRMELNGSNSETVTGDTDVYYVQILNGELKYTKYEGDYIAGNYLCSLDGNNLREFIPMTK